MSHFADIVVVDLSDVASKYALLTTLGAALDLGGPNGNVPVAHSKAGRGWGMNWDALEDSLRELHNGGIWGTARRIAFPFVLRFMNSGLLLDADPATVNSLKAILDGVSTRNAQDGLNFSYEFS